MKVLFTILTTLLLLSGSLYYLNSYQTQDQEIEAYENKLVYDKETGEVTWDLSKQSLDDYQMQSIKKTLARKYVQKYIQSDYITSLRIELRQATDILSIKPILEGISKGMDHRLTTLWLDLYHCTIDVNESFQNWYLPQSVTNFHINLERTGTKGLRNILTAVQGTNLKEFSILKDYMVNDFDWDQSFQGIMLPFTLKKMVLESQHNSNIKKTNFDNFAESLSAATLDELHLTIRSDNLSSASSSMKIMNQYQTQLKKLTLSFRNNQNVYKSGRVEFTEAVNNFISQNNQIKLLKMDLSYIGLDKYYLSELEEVLYERSTDDWKVYLTIINTSSKLNENQEIFQDVQTEMESKLKITYA